MPPLTTLDLYTQTPATTALLEAARERIADMRESEQAAGFASPEDIGPLSLCRVALAALQCALETQDWQVAAEAFVMLEDAADLSREEYLQEVTRFRGWRPTARLVPLS